MGTFLQGNKNPEVHKKFIKYYNFLAQVNFTNALLVLPTESKGFAHYKFKIKRGNNGMVIKNCFKNRWWWSKGSKKEDISNINLYWDPGRNKDFLSILPLF